MKTINNLSSTDNLSLGDLLALWSTNNGDTRKVSISLLAEKLRQFKQDLTYIDTFTELKALDVTKYELVFVLGGSSINDNKGGFYYYDTTSSLTDDNLYIIQSSFTSTGRWLRLNTEELRRVNSFSDLTNYSISNIVFFVEDESQFYNYDGSAWSKLPFVLDIGELLSSNIIQQKRGTISENNVFTGAAGEVVVDTTNNRLRVHDGVTEGGFPVGDYVNVLDYGAIADDPSADQTNVTAIQAAFDTCKNVIIPDGVFYLYNTIYPKTGSRIICKGSIELTRSIPIASECAVKIVDAINIHLDGFTINCGGYDANSGIIVRENTADIIITNTKVYNAAWDATRGGGRGVIIEANTGTAGRFIVDNLSCTNVDTVIGINGYTGSRKNQINVSNVNGFDCEKLIALFGNGTGYPHTGDSQSCVITNVTGENVNQPIRFDRGANATISSVYVYNTDTFGSITEVVRGLANNINISGFTFEGDCTYFYNFNPWQDNNTTPAGMDDFNTQKCKFDLKHIGTCSNMFLASGYSAADRINSCEFKLTVDKITANEIASTQYANYTGLFLDVFCMFDNTRIIGFSNDVSQLDISTYSGQVIIRSEESGTFTPTIDGTTTAGVGTYSVQTGSWTRLGNRVFFNAYLTWSAHTGTGNMRIGNLPFTSKNDNSAWCPATLAFLNNISTTASNIPMAAVPSNSNYVNLLQSPIGGGAVASIPMDTAGSIMVSGVIVL